MLAILPIACEPPEQFPGSFQGIVEHDERQLGFEVGGRVATLTVDEGSRVEAGAVLGRLDSALQHVVVTARQHEADAAKAEVALLEAGPRAEEIRAMRARLEAAYAAEAQLTSTLARHRALAGGPGATPASVVDELEAQRQVAIAERHVVEQELQALQHGARAQELMAATARAAAAQAAADMEVERLARYELLAPIAGVVFDVYVEAGEIAAPGAPVLALSDPAHPYVDVFVPEAAVPGVHLGAAARVHLDGLDGPLSGRVEFIAQRTEFTPKFLFSEGERPHLVVRVRVRIDDPEEHTSAGLPAFVYLEPEP
ncbi:HlyD family secretion protein [Haliangium sp.]|uniref:HlyD family secretion protein n=1 Tax=Haliangium sp. TaxID=2663208 RepID=UPI003D0B86D5